MADDFPDFRYADDSGYRINSLQDVSPRALEELKSWFERNPWQIVSGQISDFQAFTPIFAPRVNTTETTVSTTFTNLATEGPGLAGVPDGKYIIVFGATAFTASSASPAYMGVRINATDPSTDEAAVSASTVAVSVVTAVEKTLATGVGNTIIARYLSQTGSLVTFSRRWLFIMRNANR